MTLTPRQTFGSAILAGLLLAAAQAPLSLWPLLPVGLCLSLYVFTQCTSSRAALKIGWVLGTSYFAAALPWIVEPFFVDAARHGWMAPFALLLMAGGLALFVAVPFWGAARLRTPWALVVFLPVADLLRGYLFTGFPWGLWSYGWLNTPIAQAAAWIGPYALGAFSLLLCALPIFWSVRKGLGSAAAGFALLAAVGLWDRSRPAEMQADAPTIRLIQPNAPQHLKWDREHIPTFFRRSVDYTAAAPSPDLIVWPETSVPVWLNEADRALARISDAAGDVPMVLGIQRYEDRDAFNTAAVMDASGEVIQIYDKHHLVPFGEYVPLGGLLTRLGLGPMVETASGFAAGPGPQLIDLPGIGTALPLICYEAVFPRLSQQAGARPDLLLHLTNDAWFGTWAGPQQHLAQARFRAIEQGLPLLRSANTGISAVIDARGDVLRALPLGEAGFIDAPLPPARAPTLYSRTGNLPFAVFLALISALFLTRARRLQARD